MKKADRQENGGSRRDAEIDHALPLFPEACHRDLSEKTPTRTGVLGDEDSSFSGKRGEGAGKISDDRFRERLSDDSPDTGNAYLEIGGFFQILCGKKPARGEQI